MASNRVHRVLAAVTLAAAFVTVGCSGGGIAAVGASPRVEALCGAPEPGHAACDALIRTDAGSSPTAFARMPESLRRLATVPRGLGPDEFRQAYSIVGNGSPSTIIGIVDAFGAPNVEADLNVYRAHYGLSACTTANGCFRKVAQDGTTNYPAFNAAWATETDVDTQVASGICANCSVLLVEANSDSFNDLAAAVDTAVSLGATVVSNSFGTPEWSGETSFEPHWNHPGVVITASAGDHGYGVEYPAASSHVVAVGGTDLIRAGNARGYVEQVWPSTGAGCSRYIAKPGWQHDALCTTRTVADVSFSGGTNLPVLAYQSSCGASLCGWTAFGGTSVSAPAVAALYALAGNAASQNAASSLYAASSGAFFDITAGSDGTCSASGLCQAQPGYDAPSGLGSPSGLSAF